MSKKKNPKPAKVFGPGRILRDEIEARGMTQEELGVAIDRSRQFVNGLTNGTRPLTFEVAILLEAALDIDAAIWLRMEQNYRRQEEAGDIRRLQSAVRRRISSAPLTARPTRKRKTASKAANTRRKTARRATSGRFAAKALKATKSAAASKLSQSRKDLRKKK